jgi:hypothetical protein
VEASVAYTSDAAVSHHLHKLNRVAAADHADGISVAGGRCSDLAAPLKPHRIFP